MYFWHVYSNYLDVCTSYCKHDCHMINVAEHGIFSSVISCIHSFWPDITNIQVPWSINALVSSVIIINHLLIITKGGPHSLVVNADSTHAGGPGSISSAGSQIVVGPAIRQDRLSNGSINWGSLYNCSLWKSKRSLKVGKFVCLLEVLDKLYKCLDIHQIYSTKSYGGSTD